MILFQRFEQRPPQCQAVHVRGDNIDRIARYYADAGYHATLTHENGQPVGLTVVREQEPAVHIEENDVVIYGYPPTVMDSEDFQRHWRAAREGQSI